MLLFILIASLVVLLSLSLCDSVSCGSIADVIVVTVVDVVGAYYIHVDVMVLMFMLTLMM